MRHTSDNLVARYKASGLTQKAFCKRLSIPLSTLQYHLNKISKVTAPAQVPTFIPVASFQTTRQTARMIIIEGLDVQDLRKLLATSMGN